MRLFFLLLLTLPLVGNEPVAVFLTLGSDPVHEVKIQWISKSSKRGAADEEVYGLPDEHFFHRLTFHSLYPDTVYRFLVPGSEKAYTFRTLPDDLREPLRFVVGGDFYSGSDEPLKKTCRAAAKTNPAFVLLGGDIAYSALRDPKGPEDFGRWINFFSVWSREMVTEEGHLIPMVAAIGNHEVNGRYHMPPSHAAGFYTFFRQEGERSYQAKDFGNYMSLFMLDTDHTASINGEQKRWLEEAMKKRAERKRTFALYHVPAYPSYRRWTKQVSKRVRHHFVPLFDRYRLTAAFENHDHAYKRTHPLRHGKIDSEGVLYLGDGGWGVKPRRPKSPRERFYLAKTKSTRNFLLVTLDQESTSYQAIDDEGVVFDFIRHQRVLSESAHGKSFFSTLTTDLPRNSLRE